MSYTKSQVSNFLNDKILFRFSISNNFIIEFSNSEEFFTFEELERIIKSNYDYWNSIYDKAPTSFNSTWKSLNDKFNTVKNYIFELKELNIDNINNQIYYTLSTDRETREQDKIVYTLSVNSPIDKDTQFRKIRRFVSFYIEQSKNNLDEAIRNFIYLSKKNDAIGNYFSSSSQEMSYPALYLLRKNLSNIKDNISDFETSIVVPLDNKLKEISEDSDEQFREITSFIEDKHNKIQEQYDKKVSELAAFKKSLDNWQNEKFVKIKVLEDTYENKLALEAPENLWNNRAEEHEKQARNWAIFLVFTIVALIFTLGKLVLVIHDYSLNTIKNEIPFISESFILISVISFFIYIIRILIKIVLSNQHLATEYKQKAALTRFYQSLTKAGTDISKEERLIIINSLFSKVETGLVKTDTSNDSDTILAILSKNIK
ncbi:DUF6161 domain-containing protein [Streptococcus sp. SM3]|nr:DUF6161 domain-containing protein [Streptococcus sp. SM3]